jgi:di/tricarboxylate transporter
MFVAMFASMWISNVAAPVLCFSIIQVCVLLTVSLNLY